MTTPEDKAKLWLKRVSKWLNELGDGSLSDPAILLLDRLKRERDRNELKKAWDIIDDLNHLSDTSEEMESAEIRLQCGLIVAEMGNFKEAQKLFSDASSKYTSSRHHYAIAQWMEGCMEWLLPGKEVDAINSWREAEKAFEGLRQYNVNQKDKYSWYDVRCKEMHAALHQAADKYGIPHLPLENGKNENPAADGEVNNNGGSANFRSDRMGLLGVYENINAGSFGSSGILETPVGNLEVEQVFIDDRLFRILSINGNRFFKASTQGTVVIKVSGNSMDKANIQSGDYVLLRLLPKNFSDLNVADDQMDINSFQSFKDGDIVAAEIVDDEGDVATLKRVFRRGKKIVLQPQSTDPSYAEREFSATDKGFFIGGVVIAVLKPV
ncbi:MAG: hypothetical protein IH589_17885 [Anaerolineales bacterium]|nr:hypothetical protein [Anaerolineales bacterium]